MRVNVNNTIFKIKSNFPISDSADLQSVPAPAPARIFRVVLQFKILKTQISFINSIVPE